MRPVHSSEFPAGLVSEPGWYLVAGDAIEGGPYDSEDHAITAIAEAADRDDDALFGNYGSLPRA